jgi:CheY-like chemotaxis protein
MNKPTVSKRYSIWNLFRRTPKPAENAAVQEPQASKAESGKKVLIVDDDAVVLKAASMKLKSEGYGVITAVDGSSAMAAVRQSSPDVILLDIEFPPDVAHGGAVCWDGFRVMTWLKRLEPAKSIPVILMSGGEPARYQQLALAGGARGFVQKSLGFEGLLPLLEKCLTEPKAAAAI